jgi:hypothetical protein
MTFDLTKLDIKTKSEAGEKMTIYSPKTGEPVKNDADEPITITLKGRHSSAYKAAARTAQDRARERQARGVKQNDEEARNDGIDLLCAICSRSAGFRASAISTGCRSIWATPPSKRPRCTLNMLGKRSRKLPDSGCRMCFLRPHK